MRILSPVLRDEEPGISFLPHESVSSSFGELMKLREVREVKGQQLSCSLLCLSGTAGAPYLLITAFLAYALFLLFYLFTFLPLICLLPL